MFGLSNAISSAYGFGGIGCGMSWRANLGGLLSGSGTINANVTNSSQVSPGGDGSPGVLTANGKYTQTATGSLNIVIAGDAPGTGHSQLIIAGSATLDGMLNVSTDKQ